MDPSDMVQNVRKYNLKIGKHITHLNRHLLMSEVNCYDKMTNITPSDIYQDASNVVTNQYRFVLVVDLNKMARHCTKAQYMYTAYQQ